MSNKKPIIVISIVVVCLFVICLFCSGGRPKIRVEASGTVVTDSVGKPNLNVFLENSGSMDGYMAPGSGLKDAIFDYVSTLSTLCDTVNLAYVNSKTIPFAGDLESYIKTLSPQSFAAAGGNRGNSDISQIVKTALASTGENDVTLLVSDFILDLPKEDPTKYLNQVSISIRNSLNDKRKSNPNMGVVILYMESSFTGYYYYPTGGSEKLTEKTRPYYIWIFGDKRYLSMLIREAPFTEIRQGYKDYAVFCNETPVAYTVNNMTKNGNIITLQKDGDFHFLIMADLAPTMRPQNVIVNTAYYETSSSDLQIAGIETISGGQYTNSIVLSLSGKSTSKLETVRFTPPAIPVWVDECNTETSDSITSHLAQTTGIKSLVQGVADAYKTDKAATSFTVNIKKLK